jgi:hypothetical protein
MNIYSFYSLIILVCILLSKLTEIQSIDIKCSHKRETVKYVDNNIFYNFTYSQLAEYILEKERIELQRFRARKFQLRQKEDRENEIYRKLLASRVQSSFIRDFLTTRY